MMETAEDRDTDHLGSPRRRWWREVFGPIGRLHAKAALGPTVIEGEVLAEGALGMVLVADDDVVEAVPAEGADHALAEGVRFWCSRGRGEEFGAEPADTAAKIGAVDRVPVMDEEPRSLLPIGGGLDEALAGPDGAGVRRDARLDDLAAVQGEDHEDVEDPEPPGHKDEEVAGPGFAKVTSDEGRPSLTALSVQASRAALGDGAWRDLVTELGEVGRDDLLSPRRVRAPHPADQRAEVCVDRRAASWTPGAPSPKETPPGSVPPDDGLRFHQEDGVEQASRAAGQGAEEPSIESAETRALDPATCHDELLAEEQVLGDQCGARSRDRQEQIEQEAEGEHRDCVSRSRSPGYGPRRKARFTRHAARSAFSSENSASSMLAYGLSAPDRPACTPRARFEERHRPLAYSRSDERAPIVLARGGAKITCCLFKGRRYRGHAEKSDRISRGER